MVPPKSPGLLPEGNKPGIRRAFGLGLGASAVLHDDGLAALEHEVLPDFLPVDQGADVLAKSQGAFDARVGEQASDSQRGAELKRDGVADAE